MDINPEDVAFLDFQTLPKLRRQALYVIMSPPS
jgi:hypothetical protein